MNKIALKLAFFATITASLVVTGGGWNVETHDDLAEARDPLDATNGGFWDTSDHALTSVCTSASDEVAIIDGMTLSVACSEQGRLSSTPLTGMAIIYK